MGEYLEILKLDKLLTTLNVEHKLVKAFDGWRVKGKKGTAFEHYRSYGHDYDLIEIHGFGIKSGCIKGFLTADDAAEYFILSEQKNE